MRGLGNPALVKNKISLGKPTPEIPNKAPELGKPNVKAKNDSDLQNKVNGSSRDISRYQNEDGSYSVNITISNNSGKGKMEINDVKFIGYTVFLDGNTGTGSVDKKDAILMLKKTDDISYSKNGVQVGKETWSIVESSTNFKATQRNDNQESNNGVQVDKKDIHVGFKFKLPDGAGSDSRNFVYKITKLHFKYTFSPDDGSPQQSGSYDEAFTVPIVVMKLNDKVTLPISNQYDGLYSTAFFCTKSKFQLDTMQFLNEEMSPIYFKAILGLLLSQGISSFVYSINNFISTSRVKKDSVTTCYLIDFGRVFNSDKNNYKLNADLFYADNSGKKSEKVDKKVSLDAKDFIFDIGEKGIPEVKDFKQTYAVKINYKNTKDYQDFYFYVEKDPLHVVALSSNTAVNSTLNGYFVKQGSLVSCTFPAQLVQQICTGEALSYSDAIPAIMMTTAIFGLYSPTISMFELSMLMFQEFFILYYTYFSNSIADSLWNASHRMVQDSFDDTLYASAFISKYSNAKNSYNAAVQISSAQGKSGLLAIKDRVPVQGVFTTLTANATESVNPNIPYFARFNLKDTKDLFNPDTQTYLTSEIANWIELMYADIFSINVAYITNIMGPFSGMLFGGVSVKAKNKKINFAVKIGDHILNPLFNTAEHKLIADIPAKYFYTGQRDKITQHLDKYLNDIKGSKNEILKYACKTLKKVVFYATNRQLDLPFIERPYIRKGQDKQSTAIFKTSYCSPAMVFDNKKSTLTKYETGTMLPSNQKQAKINDAGQNGEIYKFIDNKLKFTPDTKSFSDNTDIIPDGISLLW